MEMFLYKDLDTPVHRLDPRTKLFLMILSFAVGVMFKNIVVLLAALLLILLHGGVGRVLSNLKRIRIVLIMITFFSIVIWTIAMSSEKGPSFLIFSLEGAFYGVMIAIKTNLMIIAGMVFLSSTKIEEISEGLVKLKVPYRGAFAFSTAIRLVPTIVGTSYTIIQAQKSRGLDLESGNLFEKIKKYVPLMVPTLVSVIRGTNVFSMALESKGFGYGKNRTNFLRLKMKGRDFVMIVVGLFVLAAATYLKVDPQAYGTLIELFPWADFAHT